MTSEVETRKSIIKIFQEHPKWSFIKSREVGVCRKTVSIVIRHFKEDLTVNRKEGSGRKKGFQSSKTAKKEGIRGSDRDHHKKYDGGDSRKN